MSDVTLKTIPFPGEYSVLLLKRDAVGKLAFSVTTKVQHAVREDDYHTLAALDTLMNDIKSDGDGAGRQFQYILDDTMAAAEELAAAYETIGGLQHAFWRWDVDAERRCGEATGPMRLSEFVQHTVIHAMLIKIAAFLRKYQDTYQEEPREHHRLLIDAFEKISGTKA